MTEEEYINHTNLRSLRHAGDCMRHTLYMPEGLDPFKEIARLIYVEINKLEKWQHANPPSGEN